MRDTDYAKFTYIDGSRLNNNDHNNDHNIIPDTGELEFPEDLWTDLDPTDLRNLIYSNVAYDFTVKLPHTCLAHTYVDRFLTYKTINPSAALFLMRGTSMVNFYWEGYRLQVSTLSVVQLINWRNGIPIQGLGIEIDLGNSQSIIVEPITRIREY